jgi:hypothetical protein
LMTKAIYARLSFLTLGEPKLQRTVWPGMNSFHRPRLRNLRCRSDLLRRHNVLNIRAATRHKSICSTGSIFLYFYSISSTETGILHFTVFITGWFFVYSPVFTKR